MQYLILLCAMLSLATAVIAQDADPLTDEGAEAAANAGNEAAGEQAELDDIYAEDDLLQGVAA